ncbi:exonuclease [Escherichia albertii]
MDFNIYEIPGSVYRRAKEVVRKKESPFKEWSAALRATPGILDYSRAANFALIRSAHPELYLYPGRLQEYINAHLTETDHENPSKETLAAARHTPEKNILEDEQATPETAEPDTTEHHQDTQSMDAQPQVNSVDAKYQELRAELHEARKNIPPKNSVDADKVLAACRGEFVEGISDPNDPKWVDGIQTHDSVYQSPQKAEQNSQNARQNESETRQESEKTCTACGQTGSGNCPDCGPVMGNATYQETFNGENQDESQEKNPEEMEDTEHPHEENAGGDQHHDSAHKTGETANSIIKANDHQINTSTSKMQRHLMIDLETMGKNPDATIISIGAIFFDPQTGEMGPEFSKAIDLETAGGIIDRQTIKWWLKQSREAQSAILTDEIPLDDALLQLREFIAENSCEFFVQVWGNGASFDNVILRRSYERQGLPCPWRYCNDRDVRTIVELGNSIGFDVRMAIPFEGVPHNALDDARHQAKQVSAIWQKLIPNPVDF